MDEHSLNRFIDKIVNENTKSSDVSKISELYIKLSDNWTDYYFTLFTLIDSLVKKERLKPNSISFLLVELTEFRDYGKKPRAVFCRS